MLTKTAVKESEGDKKGHDKKIMEMDDYSQEGGLVPLAGISQRDVSGLPALTGPAAEALMKVSLGRRSDLAPLDIVDGSVQGGEVISVELPFLLQDAGLKHLGLESRARTSQKLDICAPGNIRQ